MKVCKKCKKHVANKSKLCRYCGADVSKCKIIKSTSGNSKNSKTLKLNKDYVKNLSDNKKIIDNKDNKVVLSNENNKKAKNKKNYLNDNNLLKKKTELVKVKNDNKNNKSKIKENNKLKEKIKIGFLSFKKNKKTKKQKKEKIRESKYLLRFSICLFVLFGLLVGSHLVVGIFDLSYVVKIKEVIVKEDAKNDKIFGIGDVITYNGVDYRVDSAVASEGNSYKSPKEGNQFLIVTVSIFNNSDKKIDYSYKNWTMSNSSKIESKSIITSINGGTALYTGKLEHGVKTGSMVFEQPLKDDKLRLNFYELANGKDGTLEIDKKKKVFSVSIKVSDDSNNTKTKTNVLGVDTKNIKKNNNKNLG